MLNVVISDSSFSTKGANALPSWRLPLSPGPVHVTGDQLRSPGVRMLVGGFIAVNDVLQDLVESVSHVWLAIGVGWTVM